MYERTAGSGKETYSYSSDMEKALEKEQWPVIHCHYNLLGKKKKKEQKRIHSKTDSKEILRNSFKG